MAIVDVDEEILKRRRPANGVTGVFSPPPGPYASQARQTAPPGPYQAGVVQGPGKLGGYINRNPTDDLLQTNQAAGTAPETDAMLQQAPLSEMSPSTRRSRRGAGGQPIGMDDVRNLLASNPISGEYGRNAAGNLLESPPLSAGSANMADMLSEGENIGESPETDNLLVREAPMRMPITGVEDAGTVDEFLRTSPPPGVDRLVDTDRYAAANKADPGDKDVAAATLKSGDSGSGGGGGPSAQAALQSPPMDNNDVEIIRGTRRTTQAIDETGKAVGAEQGVGGTMAERLYNLGMSREAANKAEVGFRNSEANLMTAQAQRSRANANVMTPIQIPRADGSIGQGYVISNPNSKNLEIADIGVSAVVDPKRNLIVAPTKSTSPDGTEKDGTDIFKVIMGDDGLVSEVVQLGQNRTAEDLALTNKWPEQHAKLVRIAMEKYENEDEMIDQVFADLRAFDAAASKNNQ